MSARTRTTYTIAGVRTRFSELLDESAQKEVFIARHGKPLAALISVERYDALLESPRHLH